MVGSHGAETRGEKAFAQDLTCKQVKFGDDAFMTGWGTYDPAVIVKMKT